MSAAAQARLWTKDFTLGTAVNFLLMVNYYGLMVVVADYAMKTYDAPAATAGLAASIFIIGALAARLVSGRIMDKVGRWSWARSARWRSRRSIWPGSGSLPCSPSACCTASLTGCAPPPSAPS